MAGIRCFVAIEIPEEVRKAVAQLPQHFRHDARNLRWTRPENIHLTLKFLGDIPEKQLAQVKDSLPEAVSQVRMFSFRVAGLGAFPNLRRARILWAGVHNKDGQLVGLAQRVDDALQAVGIAPEKRHYQPHLTVARVKSSLNGGFAEAFSKYEFEAGLVDVRQLVLMRSELRPSGAVYNPLAKFNIK
jgi:2'-5' RNA ligase